MGKKQESRERLDISIIATFHKEGILAHKTVLSLIEAANLLPSNVSYEYIFSLDRPDKATKKYFEQWKNKNQFRILEVSFGNPSDNRNYAISVARGQYISLLDGDDLISKNWLSSAYEMALSRQDLTVLRPAIHAQFGYREGSLTIWKMRSSSDIVTDTLQMSYWNLWTNALFTKKSILINTPYKNLKSGFGHEDYLFNSELREKGIAQIITPETVLWYRKLPDSVSSSHINTVLGYSSLFAISKIKFLDARDEVFNSLGLRHTIIKNFKKAYRFTFDTAKKIKFVRKVFKPIIRSILYKKNINKTGTWFIDKWSEMNSIENQLWPTRGEVAKLQFHPLSFEPYHNIYGNIYRQLCLSLSKDSIDYLFLAPAMSGRGGTEKLIANYIQAIKQVHPTWNIAILSTQPFNSSVIDYFAPHEVDMIDFGRITKGIGGYEKDIIWSRFLVQSKIKRLHLINDSYWYHWIYDHMQLLIENEYKVYVSLFMKEFTHEKNRVLSFADPDLTQIWPSVTKVLTDNRTVINETLENNAFEQKKFSVHYQPQNIKGLKKPKYINIEKPIRILWASRISHQKRPDVLKAIAEKLGNNFTIDAYGLIEKSQYKASYFTGSRVNYMGPFRGGISSIPTDKYDIYLYTSETDGLPNILLEVAEAGLPIIASNIGGVKEFIKHGKTGFLANLEDIDSYVESINELSSNPAASHKLAINAQVLLKRQHSWDTFMASVRRDVL